MLGRRPRLHCSGNLHALAEARGTTSVTAVESLLITAAELHIRADLGVVDAAETTLTTDPAGVISEQSSSGLNPPQSAAGLTPLPPRAHEPDPAAERRRELAAKRVFTVEDPRFVEDFRDYDLPEAPQNPDLPRSFRAGMEDRSLAQHGTRTHHLTPTRSL